MKRYYFFSNCSWENTRIGNGYLLNGIFSFNTNYYDFNLININSEITHFNKKEKHFKFKEKLFFRIKILDALFYFIISNFKTKLKRKSNSYILATSTLEFLNIFLIKKYNIKTYLMIDSIFDDYYGSKRYIKKFFIPFAYFIEVFYIISGLKFIILNSELVSNNFTNRHGLLLRLFKVKVIYSTIWIENFHSLKGINRTNKEKNYLLIHGNFDFYQNYNGIEEFALAVKKNSVSKCKYDLIIAGKSATKIHDTILNYLAIYFKSVKIISDPISINDIINNSCAVIIASSEANGPKIKVLESCLSGKTTIAHKIVASFYPTNFPNLFAYSSFNELFEIIDKIDFIDETMISNELLEEWSKLNKAKVLISNLNLC